MSETFPAFESNLLHLSELHYPIYSCCIFAECRSVESKKVISFIIIICGAVTTLPAYTRLDYFDGVSFNLFFSSCLLGPNFPFYCFRIDFLHFNQKIIHIYHFIVCKLHMSRYCLIKIFMFNPFHSDSIFPVRKETPCARIFKSMALKHSTSNSQWVNGR